MEIQKGFEINDTFDRDGDLEITVEYEEYSWHGSSTSEKYLWLDREQIIKLRDHLTTLLGGVS